ncbi:MAG: ArsR/SmtB family transcription factor [bacterium]
MEEFVNAFKALSDRTRLRIIWLLARAGCDLCVCEIMDSLGESQYNVSRHLKVLRSAGLVREKKKGKWVFYSLADPANRFQGLILRAVSALPEELLSAEGERLKRRLSLRENGKCVVGVNSEEWRKVLNQLTAERGRFYDES